MGPVYTDRCALASILGYLRTRVGGEAGQKKLSQSPFPMGMCLCWCFEQCLDLGWLVNRPCADSVDSRLSPYVQTF